MADRERRSIGGFARTQPGRNSIGPPGGSPRRIPTGQGNSVPGSPRADFPRSPATARRLPPGAENLKQWELVQGDRGLRVVEKRIATGYSPKPARKSAESSARNDYRSLEEELVEKFRAFEKSSIVQAVPLDPVAISNAMNDTDSNERIGNDKSVDRKLPISLNAILKHKGEPAAIASSSAATGGGSSDMLDQLERQVKAIELGTIEAARTKKLRESCEFEPEIQLRYREHEDLLRNVTDDEAEGPPLHRGETTRNSTGNAGVTTRRHAVQLARTASDTRRGVQQHQDGEMPLKVQPRAQQAQRAGLPVRPIVTKKERHQQESRGPLRPLTDIMQKAIMSASHHKRSRIDVALVSLRMIRRTLRVIGDRTVG